MLLLLRFFIRVVRAEAFSSGDGDQGNVECRELLLPGQQRLMQA